MLVGLHHGCIEHTWEGRASSSYIQQHNYRSVWVAWSPHNTLCKLLDSHSSNDQFSPRTVRLNWDLFWVDRVKQAIVQIISHGVYQSTFQCRFQAQMSISDTLDALFWPDLLLSQETPCLHQFCFSFFSPLSFSYVACDSLNLLVSIIPAMIATIILKILFELLLLW